LLQLEILQKHTYAGLHRIDRLHAFFYNEGYLWVLEQYPTQSVFKININDLNDFEKVDFGAGEKIKGWSFDLAKDYIWCCHPDKVRIYRVDITDLSVTIFEHSTESETVYNPECIRTVGDYLYIFGRYSTGKGGICKVNITNPDSISDDDYTFAEYPDIADAIHGVGISGDYFFITISAMNKVWKIHKDTLVLDSYKNFYSFYVFHDEHASYGSKLFFGTGLGEMVEPLDLYTHRRYCTMFADTMNFYTYIEEWGDKYNEVYGSFYYNGLIFYCFSGRPGYGDIPNGFLVIKNTEMETLVKENFGVDFLAANGIAYKDSNNIWISFYGNQNIPDSLKLIKFRLYDDENTFSINDGAEFTVDQEVTLNNFIKKSGQTHYMASESADFTGALWKTYSTAPSFKLSHDHGTKTIYFKTKNANGFESPIQTASIRYADIRPRDFNSSHLAINKTDDENTRIMCVRAANMNGLCGDGEIDGESNWIQSNDQPGAKKPISGGGCSEGINGAICAVCANACPFDYIYCRITRTKRILSDMPSAIKNRYADIIAGIDNEEKRKELMSQLIQVTDDNGGSGFDKSVDYHIDIGCSKIAIDEMLFKTVSTDWSLWILQNDNGYASDDANVKKRLIVSHHSGDKHETAMGIIYRDEDVSNELHFYYLDHDGSNKLTEIMISGVKRY